MDRAHSLHESDEYTYLVLYTSIGSLYYAAKVNQSIQIGFD
jgi:hypothetical protein